MNRSKVDPKKEEQERLQSILLDLLKEEENKYCADCNAKTPRWAAWNLGVFICIRCAGIHRNLGVHISKVRSVNLDSWTAEQVQSMRVMGNEKARKVYEHSLPEHFRRGMSDHQMEQFIRAKYDQKRYILKDFVYPRVDASEIPRPGQAASKKTPVAVIRPPSGTSNQVAPVKATAPVTSVDLLDFSSPATAETKSSNHNNGGSLLDGLTDLSIGNAAPSVQNEATNNDFDDMFGSFVSAVPTANTVNTVTAAPTSGGLLGDAAPSTSATDDLNGFNFTATSAPAVAEEKKSNADILSLFGNSPAPSAQIVAPGGFAAFGMHAAPVQTQNASAQNQFAAFDNNVGNSSNGASSLLGLNFGGPPATMPMNSSTNNEMSFGNNMSSNNSNGFPNPFGGNSISNAGFHSAPSAPSLQSPPSPSYPVPNKVNAFADLSLGKVMSTMNMASKPKPMEQKPVVVAPVSSNMNSMNFDDLLGL